MIEGKKRNREFYHEIAGGGGKGGNEGCAPLHEQKRRRGIERPSTGSPWGDVCLGHLPELQSDTDRAVRLFLSHEGRRQLGTSVLGVGCVAAGVLRAIGRAARVYSIISGGGRASVPWRLKSLKTLFLGP